nr:Gfo/Idh/MocA family oxidoreductase [Streptomyces sp. NBC_00830]WTB35723.1 Gfo/Idh/MocA family oxidoreductase [Streptomyces sp. NBC_00830]
MTALPCPVRIGLLGCADIAWRRTVPALADTGRFDLVAVASRTGEKAARYAARFGGTPVTGYAALLERDDIDAVHIPLPPGLRAEWIERALAAGKHVLAEKPLTTSLADTARLVAAARAAGLVLWEDFAFVHHPQHAAVRRLVADGTIGELRAASLAFTVPPRPEGDIRLRADLGGGALLDAGVYPVRAALHLLGPELRVAGAALRHDPVHDVDLGGTALVVRPDGVSAALFFGLDDTYRNTYELYGTRGRLLLDRVFTPPPEHAPTVVIDGADGRREIRLEPADQFVEAFRAFATAVTESTTGSVSAGAARDDLLVRQAALVDAVRSSAHPIR